MSKVAGCVLLVAVAAGLLGSAALGQQSQSQQQIPDAPSSKKTPAQLPPPPSVNTPPPPEEQQTAPPRSDASRPANPPAEAPAGELKPITPASEPTPVAAPPAAPPQPMASEGQEQAASTIRVNVNFVAVPVTVKDDSGRLVNGLLPKDFVLLENGAKQELKFFTSDPFAMSAAVVFDLGMPDVAVRKLNDTFPALEGAFTNYDEIAFYTYSSAVRKVSDFGAPGQKLSSVLTSMKTQTGRNSGPPVLGGPFGSGVTVNGKPVDGGPIVITPPQESHVLNDALLQAAQDLGKRERGRRKVIFIISDGQERNSRASYSDVLKVLLTNEITVYAVGVDSAAIPVVGKLQRIKLPRKGYGNILPKYASATGGELFSEFTKNAIENAYSRAMGDARNSYTLGYYTKPGAGEYRQIEVKVNRANLDVRAKDGFYPLPAKR